MDAFRETCWHEPERCEQILSGTGSRPDRASICTALKELGIKGKSERKSVAKELLRLEQCCARGLENNPQAVYGRIVRHFCKSKQEIALLRVLQDRVSKQSEFRAFQDTLEDLDDNFDGTISQEDFGRSLDTLGLGLDADQRQLITRIFLARGQVKYQHFLAVLDPSLSPESNASISEDGKSFTPPASSEGAQSLSAHGDDLLQTLDGLREKVLFAQTRGVDTYGLFARFDPERSGRINSMAFRQGLEALEFDVEREGVALERILYAFRVEDEAGVDYGQFLRFLRNDYDATLGCFDSSLSFLQRDGGDNDDDLDDDGHHVAFHDTAKSGPFVAGLTDSRSTARRRKTQLARKEAAKREEGTFVRHSFTAAGHVRQVIVPSAQTGKSGRNRGGGMIERHRVTRHDGKTSGRSRSLVYDGVLQTHRSGSKKAKAKSGPRTASERLLKEASKPNAVVKYLGYSAHVCNDYPHVGYHGRSQGEKPSGNSILVRNFKSADKARKKRLVSDPAIPSKDSNSKMTRGEEEDADHSESDISALLFAAHLADQRAMLETMEAPFTNDSCRRRTSPADKVSAGQATRSSSSSNSRKAAAQAARAWDRVVSLDREKYLPTLTHALRERAAKGEPTSEPIQHLFRAARAWSIYGDFTKARDLLDRARKLVAVMGSTREKDTSQLSPAVPGRSKTRDLKSGSNGLQEATSTRAARLHIHELPVDVCALRELFTRASEQRRDSHTVMSAARMITRQCVGRDAPLSGLASLVQNKELLGFEDDDAFDSDSDDDSEDDVEEKEEGKREQRTQRIEQVARNFATAMMQRLGKESINSEMSWQDLLQYLRGQESYIASMVRVESVFTRAEIHSLRAIFVRACTTTHPASSPNSKDAGLNNGPNSQDAGLNNGYLGSAVRALGANSRLANAMQLDKHVQGFVSGERARALQDALRVYEDFSWEEYLSCVAEHASDVAVGELRRWADEVEVAIEFNELSRSTRAAYGSAERLKAASTRLELMLESRLDVVDYAEGHPSLLDVYSLLGQMQALEALSEAEAFETRVESRIDQYLSSRSGRAATDEIVRGMMEADRVQLLSKGSRASAELAARAMLRKRKDAEFRAGPGQSVLVATRKEARQHLRTARTLSELVHGFESIEACASMIACASFYLGCMDKRNDARAADLLSMVLAALDEMHFSASGSTFATIAHRLADLRASSKDYEDAGRLFARAGAIAESEGDAGLALTRWQRAFRAFEHVHGANDDQLQASSQVVALLNQVGDASAQSEAYEKHATILLRSRQGAEAVRALRQAKALAVSRKRKVVLSRLIASATSSAQLNELDPPNLGARRDTRETKTTHEETTISKAGAPASFDRDGNDDDDTGNDDDDDDDADDPNDADLEFLLQLDDKS